MHTSGTGDAFGPIRLGRMGRRTRPLSGRLGRRSQVGFGHVMLGSGLRTTVAMLGRGSRVMVMMRVLHVGIVLGRGTVSHQQAQVGQRRRELVSGWRIADGLLLLLHLFVVMSGPHDGHVCRGGGQRGSLLDRRRDGVRMVRRGDGHAAGHGVLPGMVRLHLLGVLLRQVREQASVAHVQLGIASYGIHSRKGRITHVAVAVGRQHFFQAGHIAVGSRDPQMINSVT